MRVKSQKLVLANNFAALLFNVSRSTFRKKLYRKMYKTVKTQTNLPVKIWYYLNYDMLDSGKFDSQIV